MVSGRASSLGGLLRILVSDFVVFRFTIQWDSYNIPDSPDGSSGLRVLVSELPAV